MDITAHGLLAIISGYKIEVFVNDVPLVRTVAERQQQTTVHVTPWTVNGTNELRLVIERALPRAESSSEEPLPDEPDTSQRASVEVVEGILGQIPRPGEVKQLASIDWTPLPGSEEVLPTVLIESFSLAGRPRWAWQDARPINPLEHSERARLLTFVRGIHDDFAAKRVNAILDRMNSLMSEASYLGLTPSEARQALEQGFWQLAGAPDYEVVPYDEADVLLRPVARGKIILVQRKDGSALLQGRASPSTRAAFPLFLAWMKDGLEIVRTG